MGKIGKEVHDDEQIHEGRGWLPTWWTVMLWGGILIALVYGVWIHGVMGWDQHQGYEQEVAEFERAHPEVQVSLTEEGVNPYRVDAGAISAGKEVFANNCATCHGQDGKGLIGPNVMDDEWLHGASDQVVYTLIMEGIGAGETRQQPPKGIMPAHENILGADKVLKVMAYLAAENDDLKPQ